MKVVAPAYYLSFRCLQGACRHSCCKEGWEIDIDPETLSFYEGIQDPFGSFLCENLEEGEDGVHIKLAEDGVCPFLTNEGLCSIVLKYGEDGFCQICKDHPRFRNYYTDHVEIGVGMCCEAAAELILSETGRFRWAEAGEDPETCTEDPELFQEEQEVLAFREELLELVHDPSLSYKEMLDRVAALTDCSCRITAENLDQVKELFLSLEILDPAWKQETESLRAAAAAEEPEGRDAEYFRQILSYLLYRHIPEALDSPWTECEIAAFCVFCTEYISLLFYSSEDRSRERLAQLCRLFSGEIEYSDENPDCIIMFLSDKTEEEE